MKDIILAIKSKAVALNSDSNLEELESRLIDLKQQIKILDRYLDLKMEKTSLLASFSLFKALPFLFMDCNLFSFAFLFALSLSLF